MDTRRKHRPLSDEGPFEHAHVTADHYVVLHDHRAKPHRLQDATELGSRAQMHALAHLGARPHQCVGVDHRTLAYVGPDVHERRGHDDHVLAQEGAGADRRTARNEADVLFDARSVSQRQRVFVEKGRRSGRKLTDLADAERQKDTGLDPLDGLPLVADSPGRAHRATGESVHECVDGSSCLVRVRVSVLGAAKNLSLELPRLGHFAPSASNRPTSMRALRRKASTSAVGRTSGRRKWACLCPMISRATLTGIGFVSTKIARISGSRR